MCKKVSYSWLQNILYITSFWVIFSFFSLKMTPYVENVLLLLLFTLFVSWILILIKLFQDKTSLKSYFSGLFSFQNPRWSLNIMGNIMSIIWMLCSPIMFFFYFAPEFISSLGWTGMIQNIVWNILGGLVPLALITLYFWGVILFIFHSIYSFIQYKKWYLSDMKNYFWTIFLFWVCLLWITLAISHPFSL